MFRTTLVVFVQRRCCAVGGARQAGRCTADSRLVDTGTPPSHTSPVISRCSRSTTLRLPSPRPGREPRGDGLPEPRQGAATRDGDKGRRQGAAIDSDAKGQEGRGQGETQLRREGKHEDRRDEDTSLASMKPDLGLAPYLGSTCHAAYMPRHATQPRRALSEPRHAAPRHAAPRHATRSPGTASGSTSSRGLVLVGWEWRGREWRGREWRGREWWGRYVAL